MSTEGSQTVGAAAGIAMGDESQILSVAVSRPLPGLLTYRLPAHLCSRIQLGGWVKVPLGKGVAYGFVVQKPQALTALSPGLKPEQLKDILEVGDAEQNVPADLFKLCCWAHDYYLAPLGEVLNCAARLAPAKRGAESSHSPPRRKPKRLTQAGGGGAVPPPLSDQPGFVLTEQQAAALERLIQLEQAQKQRVLLLHGVTGSGKTEVYLEYAKRVLSRNQSVLVLVPEIALTAQLHDRFQSVLREPVVLWHSGVSPKKLQEQMSALKQGVVRVVVGARSAVFAPLRELGVIIVDEEHDPSYKQEDRVRYHARDLAIVRGKITGALVVLGSATPSLETLAHVRAEKYAVARLAKRFSAAGEPQVEIVSLTEEPLVPGLQAPLAVVTLQQMQTEIDAGNQVMVYLNRRGFATYVMCKDCRKTIQCPCCSVSLTLYKKVSSLRCHQCFYQRAVDDQCAHCQSFNLFQMGAGTESLEMELPRLLKGARFLRLDRDQITTTRKLNQLLDDFRKGVGNVLLGTQMLVKGHDFPGVTLVVVVLADGLFRWPDFRANERAYQVLKQVAGRAGRGARLGRVLIQAYQTEHPVLQLIQAGAGGKSAAASSTLDQVDPEVDFYAQELELRELLAYPPFGRLARLRLEDDKRAEVKEQAEQVVRVMKERLAPGCEQGLEVLGPSEALIEKRGNRFRWDIVIKAKTIQALQQAVQVAQALAFAKRWRMQVDIDPHSM